jgi:hypothetical protein
MWPMLRDKAPIQEGRTAFDAVRPANSWVKTVSSGSGGLNKALSVTDLADLYA